MTAGRPSCEARSALVVGSGPRSSLSKWSPPQTDDRAKISSNSPGSADYLVRKRSPVRIRAWAPSSLGIISPSISPVIAVRWVDETAQGLDGSRPKRTTGHRIQIPQVLVHS